MSYFWLSFCDTGLPKGKDFLGVVIVEARDMLGASIRATELGLNIGDECLACQLPDNREWLTKRFINRVLSDDDLNELELSFSEEESVKRL